MAFYAYSEEMLCHFSGWRVTAQNTLALDIVQGECCDMGAAIKTAKSILPTVNKILTYSGDVPDTVYTLTANGWAAHLPNPTSSPTLKP